MCSLNISQALQQFSQQLKPIFDSHALDAEILVAFALNYSKTQLYTWSDSIVSKKQLALIETLINRRIKGEPIAYIVGQQEFWSLDFKVTAATLIPRPETEYLVEFALEDIVENIAYQVVDLGTGSGAIAISIAKERPKIQMLAVDNSDAALKVAIENANQLNVSNVKFQHSHWFDKIENQAFDMILSNPPYIEAEDKHLTQGDVASEPRSALISGEDGLDDIRHIIQGAKTHLAPGGLLVLEHGWNQADKVRTLLKALNYSAVGSQKDLSNIERISFGRWPG